MFVYSFMFFILLLNSFLSLSLHHISIVSHFYSWRHYFIYSFPPTFRKYPLKAVCFHVLINNFSKMWPAAWLFHTAYNIFFINLEQHPASRSTYLLRYISYSEPCLWKVFNSLSSYLSRGNQPAQHFTLTLI